MSGRLQELMVVFDRERQAFMTYLGVPWEPLGEEIRAAQQAVQEAGAAQGLRLDGPAEMQKPIAGPHAMLFFQWGYRLGILETFLSEEPLSEREQMIMAAAITAVPGWDASGWWQGNHRLPLLASDAPLPFTTYVLLPAVACPARHPPAVLAAGRCLNCAEAVKRFGLWPTRCQDCHSDRDEALELVERQGYICPVCLPMLQERVGQPRQVSEPPADAPGAQDPGAEA